MDPRTRMDGTLHYTKRNVGQEYRDMIDNVKACEIDYLCGDKDLSENLKKTEEIYREVDLNNGITQEVLYDSVLLRKQSDIINTKAKSLQTNLQHFKVKDFSEKMQDFLCKTPSSSKRRKNDLTKQWVKLGEMFQTKIHSSPSFHFIHGAFDPCHVEFKKKRRILKEKDHVGEEVTPKSVSLDETQANQDVTTQEVERVLSILNRLHKKSASVCYFEFVTDPNSFSRTVENIFYVSFLIKEGAVRIIYDEENLPALVPLSREDVENTGFHSSKQSVLSISMEDWKEIIKTYNITRSVIPPRKKK